MNEVKNQIQKYIGVKEVLTSRKGPSNDARKRKDPPETAYDKELKHKKGKAKDAMRVHQADEGMPFVASLSKIYRVIYNHDYMQKPKWIRSPSFRRNQNKYYDVHRDHGHNTDDCI